MPSVADNRVTSGCVRNVFFKHYPAPRDNSLITSRHRITTSRHHSFQDFTQREQKRLITTIFIVYVKIFAMYHVNNPKKIKGHPITRKFQSKNKGNNHTKMDIKKSKPTSIAPQSPKTQKITNSTRSHCQTHQTFKRGASTLHQSTC